MPGGFFPLRGAEACQTRVAATVVSTEGVRVACDIDAAGYVWVRGMEGFQGELDVLLADVPVRSLSARDEVCFDMQLLLVGVCHARTRKQIQRPSHG